MARIAVRLSPAGRLRFVDDGGHGPGLGDRVSVELRASPGELCEAVVAIEASQMLHSRPAVISGRVVWVETGDRREV